jgi:hypothetical protein
MLILPDRNVPRARILLPVHDREWRESSQAQPKDQFGNQNCTRFRITGRLSDGFVRWRGWFDSRDDADAFFFSLVSGSLQYERELWRLPTPAWHPDFGDWLTYDFATVTFLTSPTGSNQTYTSPSDWGNSNNSIVTLGAGASGGTALQGASAYAAGGGGGACNKITNFTFATPGTTTATYQIGTGGAASANSTGLSNTTGNNGGDSWFGGTTLGGSSVGSKGGSGGNSTRGTGTPNVTGAGGVAASGVGTALGNGGAGGLINGSGMSSQSATGGGGGAGESGDGAASTGFSSGTTRQASAGGQGNNGTGGAGGAGVTDAAASYAGGNGTEWDASHGSGGGGGGKATNSTTNPNAGSGGQYGAGGGGIASSVSGGTFTSGAGTQGIIVVTYTPANASTGNFFLVFH